MSAKLKSVSSNSPGVLESTYCSTLLNDINLRVSLVLIVVVATVK
jgi:hypothetical protein